MSIFSKLNEAKALKNQSFRIVSIVDDISKLCQDKKANFFEMMDISNELQRRININVSTLMQNQTEAISKLKGKINDQTKPKEDK